MTAVIKIKSVPPNIKQDNIKEEIDPSWIEEIAIDNVDHIAYVKLKGPQYIEAMAGRFGEDFTFPVWVSKGELEPQDFNWQGVVDTIKQKASDFQANLAAGVEAGKQKLSQVASDIQEKAESLASAAQSKLSEVQDKTAETANKVSEKVAEHVEAAKSATADAIQTGKDKLAQAKSNISQGLSKVADKVGSTIEAGKSKVDEQLHGCSEVLRKIEQTAEPIDTLPPKHRSRLIEFVLLVWLFSLMI